MTQRQANPQEQNEETYESLISLIENSQGRLAPIVVACDDWALRQRVIEHYEAEAREAKIMPYRVVLGREPSVRSALAKLKDENEYLQRGGEAVFTVTGAETLLRVTLKPEDEQSELDKFFGYLQWTREGLREFRYPIVLWVTYRILKEMSHRAPDFWSWRKAVLRFETETENEISLSFLVDRSPVEINPIEPPFDSFLPPLEELQAEIRQLEINSPNSSNLATLYEQLGQVYANRVTTGETVDLEERQAAIDAFQKAICYYDKVNQKSAQAAALLKLGKFLHSQSRIKDAKDLYQKSLEIARKIGDRQGETISLGNLGNAYFSLGQYQQAGYWYRQSLEIARKTGDRRREAISLNDLGTAYYRLSHYQQAIDLSQQSLEIAREIGDRYREAGCLTSLGVVYRSLGQYQQAIDLLQQSLEIKRKTGNRQGEAGSLYSQALALSALNRYQEALEKLQQAKQLYAAIGLDHDVKWCDEAIDKINQIIEEKSSN